MIECTDTHNEILERIVILSNCNDVLEVNGLFDSKLYGGNGIVQEERFAQDVAYLLEFGLIQYNDDFGRSISLTGLGRRITKFD